MPLRLQERRAVWRDSTALLQIGPASQAYANSVVTHVAKLEDLGIVPPGTQYSLSVLGFCTQSGRATVHFWRHERIPLPSQYLQDENLVEYLAQALTCAERAGSAVAHAAGFIAQQTLKWSEEPSARPDDPKRREKRGLGPSEHLYWSRLETPFWQFITDLPAARDGDEALGQWVLRTCRAARRALDDATAPLDSSARMLRAVARATQQLRAELAKVENPFKEVLKNHDR